MVPRDFDREAGLACVDGDETLYESVLAIFHQQLRDHFASLPDSLRGPYDEVVVRQVHSLKGSAGSVGANRIEASAAAIDRRLKSGDGDIDEALIGKLAVALQSAINHSVGHINGIELPFGINAKGYSKRVIARDFDREAGLDCVDGDEALYESVLAVFHQQLMDDLVSLPDSLRKPRDNAVMRQVHSLKGSALSVGAKRIEVSAAAVDRRLKSGDGHIDEALIGELAAALQSAINSLESSH
ncbi:Hpt domain-containing protein [Spiribacter vilamensis]|uniref:HPt (Histidine-containing phosphotransfer) domain-containing protein n=1 Tax=Spiribacter vilamensis TaxID=531306 RepID=A0A4Q8CZ37_9GAMM|nr:Hpt domain-containing protein [Spiribacter vilamensis]RZU98271.1 HPt (histidine-containing phosphotransfer) domain-containing protein [Spiribacter vilamensis]TVO60835.1 Hpt domain-containing protein [Spiribacter vilamensis]